MQIGDLVQWIGDDEHYGMFGVIFDNDEMGFGVHWTDGQEEWYEYWGKYSDFIRKL